MVGPPDGLTLEQAVERLLAANLDLLSKQFEIPQARADILTASLRGNPIFYADTQLVPYGVDSVRKPDGPTQYDINVSQPIDFAHKRQARVLVASRALKVQEAQFQDVVRMGIQNLYNAYVDVLAARQAVTYAEVSKKGLEDVLSTTIRLLEENTATSADVDQARSDREIAVVGLLEARESLRRSKRALGEFLNLSPPEINRLELKGTIQDVAPPLPPDNELYELALHVPARRRGLSVGNDPRRSKCQRSSAGTATRTLTFSFSRSRIKTTCRTARRAARRGPGVSPCRCRCSIATRATSSVHG